MAYDSAGNLLSRAARGAGTAKHAHLWDLLGILYKPHPWHGLSPGDHCPQELQCFVEMVPSDTAKYEIDKISGYLRLDRPQKYSSICPALYGFVPQSLCGDSVAELSSLKTGLQLSGDGDPLDVCILTDREIHHGDLLVDCIPIGGLRMIDGGEADDKIIAVLKDDATYGSITEIDRVPERVLERLRHYFVTYKQPPGSASTAHLTHTYGQQEAYDVIERSRKDYTSKFTGLEQILTEALRVIQG